MLLSPTPNRSAARHSVSNAVTRDDHITLSKTHTHTAATLLRCCIAAAPHSAQHTNRAFYSLRKCGIEADDVRMAVCVMRVVPARYAFVIHTKNPSNNDANEVRGALCVCVLPAAAPGWLLPGTCRRR
jgi:hypothetical protein